MNNLNTMKKLLLISLVFCGFIAMSQPASYTTQKTYIDNNIKTNGVGSITGPIANTAYTYLLQNNLVQEYDATRPYKLGQVCVYNGTILQAKADMAAGAWSAGKWKAIEANSDTLGGIHYTGYLKSTTDTGVGNYVISGNISSDTSKPKVLQTTGNATLGSTNSAIVIRGQRVMIGTTDTTEGRVDAAMRLYLNGDMDMDSTNFYRMNKYAVIGYKRNSITGATLRLGTTNPVNLSLCAGALARVFINDSSGNVGIDDSIPEERLTVTGNVKATGEINAGSLQLNVGAKINEISTDALLAGNSDLAVPTEKAVKTYIKNRTYDYTICASGCDYSDIATAFTAIPAGKSVYIAREVFNETDEFTIKDSVSVYSDNATIILNTSVLTISSYVNISGTINAKLDTISSGVLVNGNYNFINNINVTVIGQSNLGYFININGNYNNVTGSSFGNISVNMGSITAGVYIAGSSNIVTAKITNVTTLNALDVFKTLLIGGDFNSVNIISSNNTSTSGSVVGVEISAGADYNCIRGVSYGNDDNVNDSGTGNNVTGLIAP
jgi:hypothetical protein